jgi:hypothetical protein
MHTAISAAVLLAACAAPLSAQTGLDPRGRVHIPIGVADAVDTLKTFVEAEGGFSPGFASYGISFWLFDPAAGRLYAPTQDGASFDYGLAPGGQLIPWTTWSVGAVQVKTEVCHVRRSSPVGEVHVVGARAQLTNAGNTPVKAVLFAALRPPGPAGSAVGRIEVSPGGDALLVDGRVALLSNQRPDGVGVAGADTVGKSATVGALPADKAATSATGDCSGALRFDFTLAPGKPQTVGFVCPVLPGRRAVGHKWNLAGPTGPIDDNRPNPAAGGYLLVDPGLAYYRSVQADRLFAEAEEDRQDPVGRVRLRLPDRRWVDAFGALTGHLGLCLNEGAPDAAAVNYNVFTRDAAFIAAALHRAGRADLAGRAVEYLLKQPFNGRLQPEADNPGQVLWLAGEHRRFTRDKAWLTRSYESVRRLAALIKYYRTTKGPHWIDESGVEFGAAVPKERRRELKPGALDGTHPEYTEAFDLAGLRAAILLAQDMEAKADADDWTRVVERLAGEYDRKFGRKLPAQYGSYAVLWPCRLYSPETSRSAEQFAKIGAQKPGGRRCFPLAAAHQGLFAGNRSAGHGTLDLHFKHEAMRGWFAPDEGVKSAPGGWRHARTRWNPEVAMPHGWACAEALMLLRDCLLYEERGRLVLLAGVPPEWLKVKGGFEAENLPTHFGPCTFGWIPQRDGSVLLTVSDTCDPPDGFLLRIPETTAVIAKIGDFELKRERNGDILIPATERKVKVVFGEPD